MKFWSPLKRPLKIYLPESGRLVFYVICSLLVEHSEHPCTWNDAHGGFCALWKEGLRHISADAAGQAFIIPYRCQMALKYVKG